MRLTLALILITLSLSACANKGLRNLQAPSEGPDEFIVEPKAPLQQPDSYASLPEPTPGGANRTDKYPIAEGIIALGGRPQSDSGAIPAGEAALVQHASRFGVAPDIRAALAEQDEDFRRRRGRFTQYRIVAVDRYKQAYKREALDANAEARRWRNAGARTPSYPPQY